MDILNLNSSHYDERRKNDTFIETFSSLPMGDKFIVKSDRDLNSLMHKLEKEYSTVVEWAYLQEGPEEWEAVVSKKYYNFI